MASVSNSNITLDDDEGIADVTDKESTASIRSSILDYPIEHGRQYHAFKSGVYHRPNDETELERLDLMNALLQLVNSGKLHRAPLDRTQPLRILDIGTGTGIWVIDMGDQYPAAEIVGVDISASMPGTVPPNVRFEIQDVEDSWTFSAPFDYIHSRYMAGSIKDWPSLMQKCFENTKPGGWVEFQDFDIDYYSQDGSLTKDHALRRWLDISYGAEAITGRSLRPGKSLEQWMKEAGFVNVEAVRTPLPLGIWPKNKNLKMIGYLNWTQLMDGLQGMSLRLFCGLLGWTQEELEVLLAEVRKDLRNPKIHAIFDVYTAWGQKPTSR